MKTRLHALTVALIACTTPVWAATSNVDVYGQIIIGVDTTLPTNATYAAAADIQSSIFIFPGAPPYIAQSSVTTTPGATASITQGALVGIPSISNNSASASTTLGNNHAYAQANGHSLDIGIGSFSGWYDQVTITGGTGTGTAHFTTQLNGIVDVGAIAGIASYGLYASSIHPNVLGTDNVVIGIPGGTPTAPWFLMGVQVNPVIEYSIVASPYNDPNQISGLFSPPPDLGGGIPSIPGIPALEPLPSFQPDLVLTPGAGQIIIATLHGSVEFTYDVPFYLIGTLSTELLNLDAFQPFCSFTLECPSLPTRDGTGTTTLDFAHSAHLIDIGLPDGATASTASGARYSAASIPEPSSIALAGLGLIGMGIVVGRTRRRT
ncbi:MAG: PEP-CTERM sorting domain-containing protein [Thiobacillaceae bacterium]